MSFLAWACPSCKRVWGPTITACKPCNDKIDTAPDFEPHPIQAAYHQERFKVYFGRDQLFTAPVKGDYTLYDFAFALKPEATSTIFQGQSIYGHVKESPGHKLVFHLDRGDTLRFSPMVR